MNKMAHKAFMEMIKGKPFEVVGKARHRQEAKFNSENSTFIDSSIDYIEDTEELEWMDTFILTDMTYTLMTSDCRLPTIMCKGNPNAAHKLVGSTLMYLFRQASIEKMSNEKELVLAALFRQEAVREANAQAEREAVEREAAQAEP